MNSPRKITCALLLGVAGVAVLIAAYWLGLRQGGVRSQPVVARSESTGSSEPASGRRVLYWHDPMVPGQKFDRPGKSPFMDMPLVPVYADEGADSGTITVSPRQIQSLGLRTVSVQRGVLHPAVTAGGNVDWNERGLSVIQARNQGFVEKLFVRATLDRVRQGQPVLQLYVPDWVAVQEDYLALHHMQGGNLAALLEGARVRMRQAGMSDTMIARVEKTGKVQARITMTAPESGSIVELGVREGMTVAPGTTLFRLNSLKSVWVNAELPESQAALVRQGSPVQAVAAGYPGMTFNGQVQAVLPEVSSSTRTLKVRAELANPGERLAPGMYVDLRLGTQPRTVLLLPSEAVIRTGTRTVVMLAEDGGKYRPVEIKAGEESDGQVEILAGLQAGQKVVASGQFLLDSEANLRAVGVRTADQPASAQHYETDAVFESLDDDLAMLSHPAIPALKWGAMTMGFGVPESGWPDAIKAGQKVHVVFMIDKEGMPRLMRVESLDQAGSRP